MNNPSATIFNFSNTTNTVLPEDDIYVDTDSWLDIALRREHGQANQQFLTEIVKGGHSLILWSPHTTDELTQGIHVDEYIKEAQRRGIQDKRSWKKLENIISINDAKQLNNNTINRLHSITSAFESTVYLIDNLNIIPTVEAIMEIYGVPFKDAKHLAYMWHEETNNLVTRDRRFTLIPGINLYSAQLVSNNASQPHPFSSFMPDLPASLKEG